MKNIFKLMLLLLSVLPFQACSDDDDEVIATLEVTPNNISGIWKLQTWSVSDETPVVYIEFIRRDRKFKIYSTYNSMYVDVHTGTYELDTDDYGVDYITGVYDNGRGNWNYEYIVKALYADSMVLVADCDDGETQTFIRVSELPDDITENLLPTEETE